MPTQQSRSDATRAVLLHAFRESLLERGLEDTTIASVLARTGLSKGALYHHFSSKAEIFEAIYRTEAHGAIARALALAEEDARPLERLKRTCECWLVEIQDARVTNILFRIGPAAIGIEKAKRIENEFSLRLFEGLLDQAVLAGDIAITNTRLAARLLNAMMAELALSGLAKPDEAVACVRVLADAVLAGLSTR